MWPSRTEKYSILNNFNKLKSEFKFSNFVPKIQGGVAQMVERSLSMREVPGSIPGISRLLGVKLCSIAYAA